MIPRAAGDAAIIPTRSASEGMTPTWPMLAASASIMFGIINQVLRMHDILD
jgi:hypothetical protein